MMPSQGNKEHKGVVTIYLDFFKEKFKLQKTLSENTILKDEIPAFLWKTIQNQHQSLEF
jgi:hypothetical protein